MSEKCKTCKKEFDTGIWIAPQFIDEKVLLFCSNKCKKDYIKMKLDRLKSSYPKYYDKVMKSLKSPDCKNLFFWGELDKELKF